MPEPHTRASAAADRLTKTTDEILAEVERLPAELIHWVPGDGVWTVMDNLCHIREFVPFWTGQALRIVRHSAEPWGRDHTDTARLAAVTNTAANRLEAVVADIREGVRRSAETLRTLSDEDLAVEATSRNPRWGKKPASFVVEDLLVHHVEKHQGQIRRNVAQFRDSRASGNE
jgi:uncharacterized damage-inducible protein DinB